MEEITDVARRILDLAKSQGIRSPNPPPSRTQPTVPRSLSFRPGSDTWCPDCRGVGWLRSNLQHHEEGFGQLVPCECRRNEIGEHRRKRLERISGLLPNELEMTLANASERCTDTPGMIDAVREFIWQPYGFLTLWGGPGNGKTLMLQAAVNELRKRRRWVGAYVRFVDLLDYIRAGFAKDADGDARQRYQVLKEVQVLAIDEVDKTRLTEFAWEFRTRFLDDRYRLAVAGLAHTLFALNDDPSTLDSYVWDRLRDGRFRVYRNRDQSVRPILRQEAQGGS